MDLWDLDLGALGSCLLLQERRARERLGSFEAIVSINLAVVGEMKPLTLVVGNGGAVGWGTVACR